LAVVIQDLHQAQGGRCALRRTRLPQRMGGRSSHSILLRRWEWTCQSSDSLSLLQSAEGSSGRSDGPAAFLRRPVSNL